VERAADRVRDAFSGWSKLTRMSFPGERRGWTADRTPSRDVRWRLSQSITVPGEEVTLGLAGQGEQRALLAAAVFRDGERPTGARLLVRHLIRAPLPTVTGDLSGRGPAAGAARVFAAEAASEAPRTLLKVRGEGTVFRFPAAAADALGQLDPREAVAVEFALADGRRRTAWFEVGDFAAGRVFVAAGG
jgi:hypothetical protein